MAPTPQSTATKTKSIQSIFLRTKASDDLRSENNQEETHIELAQTEGFKQPPRTAPMRQATGSRRDIFQRAASQPLPEAPSTLTLLQATAKLPPLNVQSTEVNTTVKNGRSSMFESCIQVLATVITASFHTINTHQTYKDTSTTAPDSTTIRTAKLLYVSMLERVQKERGEWQGFNSDEKGPEQHDIVEETVADVLNASLRELKNAGDEFLVLNELMDVSFRNLRGALISPQLYIKHKPQLMQALMPMQEDGSMARGTTHFPPSFSSLLTVRAFLNEINRDEVLCLLRLLCLWAAIGTVSQRDPKEDMLKRVIEDKHSRVFSEIPETAFIAGRKDDRQDPLAIDLLLLLLHYRDILFGDIEYLMIRQEMKVTKSVDSEEPSSAITCAPNQSTKSILSNKACEGVLLPPRQEMNVTKPVDLREPSSATTNTPDGCTKSILGNKPYEGVTRKGTQQPVKLILKSPKKQKSRMARHHLMDENHTQRLVESAEKTNSVRHRQKATVNTTKTPKKQALTTVLCKALPKPTNSTFIENYWKISAATVTLCAVLGITCLAFRKSHP